MVRDDHVRLQHQGLVDDVAHGIHREEHASHGGLGIAAHESDRVPVSRERRWVALLEQRGDLSDGGWHGLRLPRGDHPAGGSVASRAGP